MIDRSPSAFGRAALLGGTALASILLVFQPAPARAQATTDTTGAFGAVTNRNEQVPAASPTAAFSASGLTFTGYGKAYTILNGASLSITDLSSTLTTGAPGGANGGTAALRVLASGGLITLSGTITADNGGFGTPGLEIVNSGAGGINIGAAGTPVTATLTGGPALSTSTVDGTQNIFLNAGSMTVNVANGNGATLTSSGTGAINATLTGGTAITTTNAGGTGISATASGAGVVSLSSDSTISTTGPRFATGIDASVASGAGSVGVTYDGSMLVSGNGISATTAGTGTVTVAGTGTVATNSTTTTQAGIVATSTSATAGAVSVGTAATPYSGNVTGPNGIIASSAGTGAGSTVSVFTSGTITGTVNTVSFPPATAGIAASSVGGLITIGASGPVTSPDDGIRAVTTGGGGITITTAAVTGDNNNGGAGRGIVAQAGTTGSGNVQVTANGAIHGTLFGIQASAINSGTVLVTLNNDLLVNSTGNPSQGQTGIGTTTADGSNTVRFTTGTLTGNALVAVTNAVGISASSTGAGTVTVDMTNGLGGAGGQIGTSTASRFLGDGVDATSTGTGNVAVLAGTMFVTGIGVNATTSGPGTVTVTGPGAIDTNSATTTQAGIVATSTSATAGAVSVGTAATPYSGNVTGPNGIIASSAGTGAGSTVSVFTSGTITGTVNTVSFPPATAGIAASSVGGLITIGATGLVTSPDDGIRAVTTGGGGITITTAAVTGDNNNGGAGRGIVAQAGTTGSGNVQVTANGAIHGTLFGIQASAINSGTVLVTLNNDLLVNSTGNPANGQTGIGTTTADGSNTVRFTTGTLTGNALVAVTNAVGISASSTGAGTVTVDMTNGLGGAGGQIGTSTASRFLGDGVDATSSGTGNVAVLAGTMFVTGIGVNASHTGTGVGDVAVDQIPGTTIDATGNGINATNAGTGSVTVGGTMRIVDVTSGAVGINAASTGGAAATPPGLVTVDTAAGGTVSGTTGITASSTFGSLALNIAGTVTGTAGNGVQTTVDETLTNPAGRTATLVDIGVIQASNGFAGVSGNNLRVTMGAMGNPIGTIVAGGGAGAGADAIEFRNGTLNALNFYEATSGLLPSTNTSSGLTGNIDLAATGTVLELNQDTGVDTTVNNVFTNGAGTSVTVNKTGPNAIFLSGTNTAAANFTGTAGTHSVVNVNAGILGVTGTFGDAVSPVTAKLADVNVNNGGTLHGDGIIDANLAVNAGGILSAGNVTTGAGGVVSTSNAAGTLTVNGNLVLNPGSRTIFNLDLPTYVGGASNDLIRVANNLTISGTLALRDTTEVPVVTGVYRVFEYGGTATVNPSYNIEVQAGSSARLSTDIPNEVNVFVNNGSQIIQFWDGNDMSGVPGAYGPPGGMARAQGGDGDWTTTNTNWTYLPGGEINDRWQSQVGVFGEETPPLAPGNHLVTVAGVQDFQGLQFSTTDYVLSGGTLNATGNPFTVAADQDLSFLNITAALATINSNITGSATTTAAGNPPAGIDKMGTGTLRLGGVDSYTGRTRVDAGILEVTATGRITASSSLSNGAGFQVDSGGSATFGTADNRNLITVFGTLATTNGLVNEANAIVNAGIAAPAPAAVVNGPITNAGNFNVAGVATSNATFANQAGAFLSVGVGGTAGTYSIAQLLTNDGTVSVTAGSTLNANAGITNNTSGLINNNGTINDALNNAGVANNNAGATWNGDVASNTGTINNAGTWNTLAAGFNTSGIFNNTGVLNANAGGLTNTGTVTANNTILGPINNNAGFFNLNGNLIGNNSFTNLAPATLNVGGNTYAGVTTLDNFGTVNLGGGTIVATTGFTNENGGVLNSDNGTITAPTFTNSGRISTKNATVGDVTTINGNYVATGAAALTIDVDLRNTVPNNADRLQVNGTVAGNTLVSFANPNGLLVSNASTLNPNVPTFVGGTLIKTTPVVTSNGGAGTFTPAQGQGTIFATNGGLVQYQLQQTSPGNFAIVSGANTGAITPVATSLSSAFGAISTSFFQSSSAFVVPASGNGPDQFTYGPWIRVSGGAADIDSTGSDTNLGQSAKSQVDTTFEGFQAGFDSGLINVDGSNTNFHIGVTTGIVGADADEKKANNTSVNFSIPFVGVYGAVKHEDFSADVTYRHDFVDLRVNGPAVARPTRIDADGDSIYGNLLYGIAAGKFSIIPSLGLGYSHYDIDNLPTILGGSIAFRNFDSLLGRLGVQVGRTVAVTDKFAVQPFITGAIWHEFEGDTVARFSDVSGFDQIMTTRVGTFGQVGVGVSAQLVPVGFTGFLRGDFRFGDKLNGQVGTMGIRYSF